MAPPSYSDLGKEARDLLSKGYHFGTWRLDAKTKSGSNIKFKTFGVNNTDNGKVLAGIENEYACSDYGVKFTEKWNTDNQMGAEISIEDQLVKGLKVAFDSSFNPSSGKKKAQVKTTYKGEFVQTNADVDFDYAGPTIKGAAVVGYKGWLAGYQMAFDTAKSKLSSNNFALAYNGGDFILGANCNDGQDFGGSYHHKINKNLEAGVTLGWTSGTARPAMNLGAKYSLSSDTTVRAKVSCSSVLGLSLQQKIRDGVTMTLSTAVDGKNFNAGGHRVGLAMEFEQ